MVITQPQVQTRQTRHWCVVGTGALANLWLERLVAQGEQVSVYSRHPEDQPHTTVGVQRSGQLREITVPVLPPQPGEHGQEAPEPHTEPGGHAQLAVDTQTEPEHQQAPPAYSHPAASAAAAERIWLVMVKAWQLEAVLTELKQQGWLGKRETLILSHNGLGAAEALLQQEHGWQLYDLVTTHGAWRPQRTISVHAGRGESWLGPRYSAMKHRPQAAQRTSDPYPGHTDPARPPAWFKTFAQALPPVEWDPSVYYKRLEKLAINCAINPLATLANGVNGILRGDGPQHEGYDRKIQDICAEVAAVYPELKAERLYERVQKVLRATAGNHCSMLQDIKAGRRTEIDYLNGHICATGQQQQIATPLNCELATKIRLLQDAAPR